MFDNQSTKKFATISSRWLLIQAVLDEFQVSHVILRALQDCRRNHEHGSEIGWQCHSVTKGQSGQVHHDRSLSVP